MSGKDSTVSATEFVDTTDAGTDEEIDTALSLHPDWKISQEDQYVLRFLNNDLQPLKPNQISLSGIELVQENNRIVATAFVRNSLSKTIKLGETTLLLMDDEDKILARKQFDLSVIGEIPARSSRPWHFAFENKLLTTSTIPKEGWKLAFWLKSKHRLDLEESWEKSLSKEGKAKLQEIIESVGEPKDGELNFLGVQAIIHTDGNLHVTLLIRNGSTKDLKLEQLPLQIFDATDEIVAKGGFKLDNLEIKANTSKPWTFIFPKEMLLKESLDFSRWKAVPAK